jgi:hypothetical protein
VGNNLSLLLYGDNLRITRKDGLIVSVRSMPQNGDKRTGDGCSGDPPVELPAQFWRTQKRGFLNAVPPQNAKQSKSALKSRSVVGRDLSVTGVISGGSILFYVTLSQAVSANTTVSLNSSSALLSVPASITISAGNATGSTTAIRPHLGK